MRQILVKVLTQNSDRRPGGIDTIDPKEIAILCAKTADDKKASDIFIFDVQGLTFITDFLVICSGFNERQLQGIAKEIELKLHSYGIHWMGMEGYQEAKWILMDYGDVIVHLFDKEMRHFYDLELLWGDAQKLPWKADI
ncbi:MAG: ribosome silencing factor [Planctomycetia bacterium]|nr:ribosome silencing factor [Candidatus Brocadia sp.]MDG6004363.1 ribosome silencing factor [Candidatus Brocadia sp.]QOJ05454.1 MAG: ribosome silencing factor [Planctomycetia bacterium]TVL98102.1 MAG: ribosome silencing factor [Candidatus Brocadia sp. BL1]